MIIHQSLPEGQQYTSGIDEYREGHENKHAISQLARKAHSFQNNLSVKEREGQSFEEEWDSGFASQPADESVQHRVTQGNRTSRNVWGKGYFVFCMSTSQHAPAFSLLKSLVIPVAISHSVATVSSLSLFWGSQNQNSNRLWPNWAEGVSPYTCTEVQLLEDKVHISIHRFFWHIILWLHAYSSFYYVLFSTIILQINTGVHM